MSDRLLTLAEAAPLLCRSVSGLRKLLRHPDPAKRPPAHRVGGRILFYAEELEAFVKATSVEYRRIQIRPTRRAVRDVKARLELIAQEARS